MTDFDQAVALTADGPNRWRAELPPDWAQGRTTFGGVAAALATQVAQQVAGPQRPLRRLDVAFVAPLPPGPAQITAEALAQGRAITSITVDVRSVTGDLGVRVDLVAGAGRESPMVVPGPPALKPAGPGAPADSGIEFPYIDGVTPVFSQHIAMRWCGTGLPFTGTGPEGAVTRVWVRHRTRASGLAAVVALLDVAPPTVLPMATRPVPASTVRWSIHLLAPIPDAASSGWFWLEGEALHAAGGYAVEHARLYRDGELVASSQQLVAVYDTPAPR